MADKKFQRFLKGMNQDVNGSMQPDDSYRSATNMDMVAQGDELILNQFRSAAQALASSGSTSITQRITPTGGDALLYNILGYTSGIDSDGNECLVMFVAGTTAGAKWSRILVYHLHNNLLTEVGASGDTSIEVVNMPRTSLDFPLTGSVDALITKDRGRSFCYFVDGVNPIRRFLLKTSVYTGYTAAEQLDVPRFFPSQSSVTAAIKTDGSLLAGTYQFAFRYKNSTLGSYTKWSLVSNPIPVIPDASPLIGGSVGEVTNKSIDVSVSVSAADDSNYDFLELAAIKNDTGDRVGQDVAFVSTHSVSASGTLTISYNGRLAEYELPVSEVVVDDAAIETVRTLVETNERILAGDVNYFDRLLDDDEGLIVDAKAVTESVDYATAASTPSKKGYFRDEVYRFGITYHDKYGNWSPPKPIDFSGLRRETPTDTVLTIVSLTNREVFNTNYSNNLATIETSATVTGISIGDVVRINFGTGSAPDFRYYEVVETSTVNILVAAYENFPTLTPTETDLVKCLGNAYSHSASTDYKFPDRDKVGYSILRSDDTPNALGITITVNGLSHPSWAIGFAIVRMERDRNVLYQAPIVPSASRLGNVTPGKNTINNRDYDREFDHLAPKILQLGVARGMTKPAVLPQAGVAGTPPVAYEYVRFNDTSTADSLRESQSWDFCFIPALDFVANNNGLPLVELPDIQQMDVSIKDMAAFARVPQTNAAGAKVYSAATQEQYFHDGSISSYKIETTTGTFVDVYLPRIQDSIAVVDRSDNDVLLNTDNFNTEQIYPIVNDSEPITLSVASTSNNGSTQQRILAGNSLVQQQGRTPSIDPAVSSFFEGNVVAQRGIGIKVNQQLLDPLAPIAKRYNSETLKREVPFSNYVALPTAGSGRKFNARLYNNADMVTPLRGTVGSIPVLLNDRVQTADVATNVAQVFFVANLELGKSDFRYGAADSPNRYVWTGAYHKISGTSNVEVSVFGGDCFITKQTYRVNDSVVIPRVYTPQAGIDGVTWNNAASNNVVTKSGVSNNQPEFIELFVEAECNSNYLSDRNIYPFANDNISDYTTSAFYRYNFGYSSANNYKSFFSQDKSVEFIPRFPARTIFTDARVLGLNEDSYSRFRALNFYDLEEKYGAIKRLALLNDSDVIAVQEQSIRALVIGKNIIEDEDGNTLSIQSGEFISNIKRYLTTQYGAQNLRAVVSTEFGVFVLDTRVGTLLNVSNQMAVLPLGRMEKYFNDNFSNKKVFAEPDLSISYDKTSKYLHIIGRDSGNAFHWLLYNAKLNAFVTFLDYTPAFSTRRNTMPAFVTAVGGRTIMVNSFFFPFFDGAYNAIQLRVNNWGQGSGFNALLRDTTAVQSSLEYVFSEFADSPKTIDIIGANGLLPFTSYSVTAFNDGGASETTGVITGNTNARNGQTYANFIRDNVSGGRLRGVFANVVMNFNQTDAAIKLYSVFTQFRQLFRP